MVLELTARKSETEYTLQNYLLEFLSSLNPQSRELFENFIKSPYFENLQGKMEMHDRQDHSAGEELEYCKSIAGYFHEYIAYDYASNYLYPNSVVLSPDTVTQIFKKLLGKKAKKYGGELQVAIPGTAIPDGLVLNLSHDNLSTQVDEILEYKIGGVLWDEKLVDKFRNKETWVRRYIRQLTDLYYQKPSSTVEWLTRRHNLPPILTIKEEVIKYTYLIPTTDNKILGGENTCYKTLPYSYSDIWQFAITTRIYSKFNNS